MTLWTTNEITEALADELKNSINNPENLLIENVFIDSRKKVFSGLFVALKGENTDGHKYLAQAFENGANFAIVDQIPEEIKNSEEVKESKKVEKSNHEITIKKLKQTKLSFGKK